MLIASSASITINGTITANGGQGTHCSDGGGGGGGGIRLVAPRISGQGTLSAVGGSWLGCCAACNPGPRSGSGVIRLEAFQHEFSGGGSRHTPFALFLTPTPPPSVRVVSVAGVSVPPDPTGSFTMPDVTIDRSTPVTVAIEGHNIPLGTIVELFLFSEDGAPQVVNSTPLAGTPELSTATASVLFPPGFTRGFVHASFQ